MKEINIYALIAGSAALGLFIALSAFLGYQLYSLRSSVTNTQGAVMQIGEAFNQDHATLAQIVTLINKSMESSTANK